MSFIAVSKLFNQTDIFVIPTFQRPFAWEEPQWQDLIRDVDVAIGKTNPMHYFGAIHTVKVVPTSPLWRDYTDPENPDIQSLSSCNFQTDTSYDVHLVIDGQQRLLALFALLECCHKVANRNIALPNGCLIPKLILNPAKDHDQWRFNLGLNSSNTTPLIIETHSQNRICGMFEFFKRNAPKQGSKGHNFLIGPTCDLTRIELRSDSSLAPFLTLNDRGKDLTRLEKVKSLAMQADENGSYGFAHRLNVGFGNVYRSIDQNDSQLDEDNFVRQLSIVLWEATGVPAHQDSLDDLYALYRKQLLDPTGIASALLNGLISHSNGLSEHHNQLVNYVTDSRQGKSFGQPSFVNGIFLKAPQRDVANDYQMVIDSLGLQPKQLAVLFAIRERFGIDWHTPLGNMRVTNRDIKQSLLAKFAAHQSAINLSSYVWAFDIKAEIDAIPDEVDRVVTPLYLVELLRLIVADSKPGTFTTTWQNSFGVSNLTSQTLLDTWVRYLLSRGSRDRFILYDIAYSLRSDNQETTLKHLMREFECCLPGGVNAHCTGSLDIEHFFARDFSVVKSIAGHGFVSKADYDSDFVDRPGNKLLLDKSLNISIKDVPIWDKAFAYRSGRHLSMQVALNRLTQSAQQIAHDIQGCQDLAILRCYVELRQLRLAAFAANRF